MASPALGSLALKSPHSGLGRLEEQRGRKTTAAALFRAAAAARKRLRAAPLASSVGIVRFSFALVKPSPRPRKSLS